MDEIVGKHQKEHKLPSVEFKDIDDESILALENEIEECLGEVKINIVRKGNNQENAPQNLAPVICSVKVKVEKIDDINEVPDTENQVRLEEYDDADKYIYRFIVKQSSDKSFSSFIGAQFTLTKAKIYEAMLAQAKDSTSSVDKYFEAEIRNQFKKRPLPLKEIYDELLFNAIERWKRWFDEAPLFRDSPLLYKCYICNEAWWRYYIFREHLKRHTEALKLVLEERGHECFIAATFGSQSTINFNSLSSDCPKCGKSYDKHACYKYSKYVECDGCKGKFVTCSKLRSHENMCTAYIMAKIGRYGKKSDRMFRCELCSSYCLTRRGLQQHMVFYHSVWSDIPTSMVTKTCRECKQLYVNGYHDCLKRANTIKCKDCFRKYKFPFLAALHMDLSRNDVPCEVCGLVLKECTLLKHMAEHTENYAFFYAKKYINKSYTLYSEAVYKSLNRRKYLQMKPWHDQIVVPKKCLTGDFVDSVCLVHVPEYKIPDFLNSVDSIKEYSVLNDSDYIDIQEQIQNMTFGEHNSIGESAVEDKSERTIRQLLKAKNMKDANVNSNSAQLWSTNSNVSPEKHKADEFLDGVYDDDIIIIDDFVKPVIVLTDSEDEIDEMSTKNKVSKLNENLSGIQTPTVKIERLDEVENHSDRDINNIVDLDEINDISKINNENALEIEISSNVHIKREEIEVCKSVKNTELEDIDVHVEEDIKPIISGNICENPIELEALLKTEGDENETKSLTGLIKTEDECSKSKRKVSRLYSCNKCFFQGLHRDYVEHKLSHKVPLSLKLKKKQNKRIRIIDQVNYDCTKCGRMYGDLEKYVEHFTQHGFEKHACPICGKYFSNNIELAKNMREHVNRLFIRAKFPRKKYQDNLSRSVYQCLKCKCRVYYGEKFDHWETHLELDPEKTFLNDETDYWRGRDQNDYALEPDIMKNVIDAVLVTESRCRFRYCFLCKRDFARANECKRHLIQHLLYDALAKETEKKTIVCQICGMEFLKIDTYKQHMRDHASLPLYKCEECSKCFADSSNYAKHTKIHNIKAFICDLCMRKFKKKIGLERHMLMHRTTPSVLCELCPSVFFTQTLLRKHMMKHNKRGVPDVHFSCRLCRKKFNTAKERREHLSMEHNYGASF